MANEPKKQRPQVKVQTTVTTVHHNQILLNANQIRTALDNCGITVPPDATIRFLAEGDGNYYNISEQHPIIIEWSETETEGN